MKEIIHQVLESVYGQPVTIQHTRSVGGGSINQTQALTLSNGENVFLKTNSHPPPNFFPAEAKGLELLRQAQGGPRIPKPLGMEPGSNPRFFLLEFVENSAPSNEFHLHFAEALAHMHRVTQESHGLDHDNYIGSTVQENTPEKNGLVFFREHRLRFQQELARKAGKLPAQVDQRLDRLCGKLETLLDATGEKPALLHGDLWSGNYFQASQDRQPCIFDPAVYYGLRESDLAMTELFGRLPESFYQAYHEAFPLNPGYEERRDLYNLYHMLNHLNLFGSSYLSSVESIINRFTR
ncbi:MAG: fructosamine kinase family protein [Nitrospinae bacterium]|jgi:protein-ribulosamine 3-kinase|nr:fructosamine kinase family protein [Nitrospinota bacterium]MDA1110426.1 fructosamine kinase family protein [Nitrospinota bacterium]